MTNLTLESAKFFCGFEAFHTVFHAYLWLSGTVFIAFGVTATPTLNMTGTVVHGAISLALGFYAWGKRDGKVGLQTRPLPRHNFSHSATRASARRRDGKQQTKPQK